MPSQKKELEEEVKGAGEVKVGIEDAVNKEATEVIGEGEKK